ncbi:DNA independent RNA polymerase I transcription factor, partial [Coemansia sp. RSA 2708]
MGAFSPANATGVSAAAADSEESGFFKRLVTSPFGGKDKRNPDETKGRPHSFNVHHVVHVGLASPNYPHSGNVAMSPSTIPSTMRSENRYPVMPAPASLRYNDVAHQNASNVPSAPDNPRHQNMGYGEFAPSNNSQPTTTGDNSMETYRTAEQSAYNGSGGDLDEYQKLVKVFAYTRYQSATAAAAAAKYVDEVSPWILALSANVSALGITYRELVHTVFFSDWITAPNPRFVTRYATLILQIVSAHPEWVPQAMGALVRWFSFGARRSDTAEAPLVHDRVHLLVQEIYRTIPTCGSSLVAALSGAWPFRTIKTNVQVLFVRNTLQCLEYAEGVRRDVLRMVLNHVIQIDVEVQVELDDL